MASIITRAAAAPATAADGRAQAIPPELRALDRWVVWRSVPDADPRKKPRKVPTDPRTGGNASSTDPGTWRPFAEAETALRGGG
jgi:primase-polymerase (primpol)-like protein